MPMTTIARRWAVSRLEPILMPGGQKPLERPVNLAPSTTYLRGTILGLAGTTAVNDVQTFTATGTPTGGSFSYTVTNPLTGTTATLTIPYNATSAVLQGLVDTIFGTGNLTAGGGAWPGTALTLTGAGSLTYNPVPIAVAGTNALTGGTTPTSTVAHTTTGRSAGTYAAYVDTTVDPAKCILPYDCITDASGNITLGAQVGGGLYGETYPAISAWFGGYFRTIDLVGLDAGGITDLGKLISGTLADGVLYVSGM